MIESMRSRIALVLLALALPGCGGGGGGAQPVAVPPAVVSPSAFNYRPVTADDIAQVRGEWAGRDLAAHNVAVVHQTETASYQLTIYSHRVGANIHYGAVVKPLSAAPSSLPVLVLLDGLDQSNPSMDLGWTLSSYRSDAVLVVPAFRGRTLRYSGMSFPSGGDFCDAYDGATDDAIAMLNVAAATTP